MSDSLEFSLNTLRKSGELCDAVFFLGPDKKEFKAHKLVLALISEVFKLMFYGRMAEEAENANGNNKPTIIEIPDVHPNAFDIFLKFAYGNRNAVDYISVENALKCIYAANKYMVKPLTDLGIQYVETKIDVENSCHVHQMALMLNVEALSEKCSNFIVNNSAMCLLTNGFTLLAPEAVIPILEKCAKNVEPMTIFKAISNWGQQRITNEASNSSMRNLLENFLPFVRFLSMSPSDFFHVVASADVLTDEELVSITLVIYGNEVKGRELPSWLNRDVEADVGKRANHSRSRTQAKNTGVKNVASIQLRNQRKPK